MADSNTSAPAGGDSQSSGTEFSKPTGVNDGDIWEKHFGKGAKDPEKPTSSKRGSETGSKAKETTGSRESRETPEKERKGSTGKSERESKASSKSGSEKSEPSTRPSDESKERESSSSSKDPKPKSDASKTDKDSEKDDDPADPEAPLKKARDLYAEAKKAADPKEARKLYKRAIKEALGELPPEFDDGQYAAVRRERKAAKAALDEQASRNETRIKDAAEKLKPAIYVMRQLEGAGISDKLTVPLVEKAIGVIKALRHIEDGDFTQLAEVVSKAAGVDHDEAMKRFVRGVKVSPEGRAARQAAEQAQRENRALQERLANLEKQLQERDTAQTESAKKAERERQQAEHRERYLEQIETDLDGHPVLKLKNGRERVLRYLIRTADPKLRSPTVSFERAANIIVASERRRAREAQALDTDGEEAPSREEPRRLRDVSRGETVDSGVRSESAEQAFDRIFSKHSTGGRRR